MPAKDGLALDDQLCFALYAASRAMTARYRPYLDAIGLTYPQYLVMVVLWDEGPATVGRLGERLRLDSGTLSPLLKRLDDNGLISRSRRPDDERSVEVRVTAKGRRLRDRAARIPAEIQSTLGGLDQDVLMDQLHLLESRLRDI
jgi:DNA-binding MarR family transcriptional regulator